MNFQSRSDDNIYFSKELLTIKPLNEKTIKLKSKAFTSLQKISHFEIKTIFFNGFIDKFTIIICVITLIIGLSMLSLMFVYYYKMENDE